MTSYNFKVVLLGQGCVGKTSLVLRYVSDKFNESHQSTIQASYLRKQLYLDQDLVQLNIWDTAGQEKFHALGPIYYREANGALLVYDVTSADSLRRVRDWIKELRKTLRNQGVCLAIIGNKCDLLRGGDAFPETVVQEAQQMSDELPHARHYLTSAKFNQGIGELFLSLSRRMIEQHKRAAIQRQDSRLILASSRLARPIATAHEEVNSGGGPLRVIDRSDAGKAKRRGDPCHC